MIMNRVRQRSISTLKNQFELNLEDGELTAARKTWNTPRTQLRPEGFINFRGTA